MSGGAEDGRPPGPPEGGQADAVLVRFARSLQAGPDRTQAFLAAVAALDAARRADVYWAGRLTLCGSRAELDRYDEAFASHFSGHAPPHAPAARPRLASAPPTGEPPQIRPTPPTPSPQPPTAAPLPALALAPAPAARQDDTPPDSPRPALASRAEVLRHRDLADLTPAELADVARLLAVLDLRGPDRRTARRRASHRGPVDAHRTARETLRRGGEPARLRHRTRAAKPRRVVLLADVSGSMAPYADAFLRFAHAAARTRTAPTEAFTIGTRLTRVTRRLTHPDPDTALRAAAAAIPDFSGGTRLGETIREFLDRWGRRGLARGAVVVVLSDGWERDDPNLLAAQMRALHRLAHRVIWANPRKYRPGYAPLAAGMAAALPSVDAFAEGHSLAALEKLAALVRDRS
ncbi:vWA domain-containing protein [Streptomyces boninensis]|uniref:vWA domain-containing protein n=1 Tax=Streptomyces boninensis TaxID=2039455 RepID=UPI003B21FCF4